eukprot:jgi/Tetstr1/439096/TSEL_002962.t1
MYEDPHTGRKCKAAVKFAVNNARGMAQVFNESAILRMLNDPEVLSRRGHRFARKMESAVKPLFGSAEMLDIAGPRFQAAAAMMEYAESTVEEQGSYKRADLRRNVRAMEDLPPGNLIYNYHLDQAQRFLEELVTIAHNLVHAVDNVNDVGVLHTNIRPENALVTLDCKRRVIICGFGTALTEEAGFEGGLEVKPGDVAAIRMWHTHQLANSKCQEYMQPEAIRVGSDVVCYDSDGWAALMVSLEILGLELDVKEMTDTLLKNPKGFGIFVAQHFAQKYRGLCSAEGVDRVRRLAERAVHRSKPVRRETAGFFQTVFHKIKPTPMRHGYPVPTR